MSKRCKFCCTKLEDVSVQINDKQILKEINLHIHCNQITSIIGPNGAGKTTLFKTLLGEIDYKGRISNVMHEHEKVYTPIIGYVPQHLSFDRSTPISVLDLFQICIEARPAWLQPARKFRSRVEKSLAKVEIAYAIDRKIGALSGGELQRVLLALALMPKPDILLLDEPISGVDVNGKKMFYEIVKKLKEENHMAIVMITHDLPLLPQICDQTILLDKEIIMKGDPVEVLENSKTKEIFYMV